MVGVPWRGIQIGWGAAWRGGVAVVIVIKSTTCLSKKRTRFLSRYLESPCLENQQIKMGADGIMRHAVAEELYHVLGRRPMRKASWRHPGDGSPLQAPRICMCSQAAECLVPASSEPKFWWLPGDDRERHGVKQVLGARSSALH
jgi:hypothetical protein